MPCIDSHVINIWGCIILQKTGLACCGNYAEAVENLAPCCGRSRLGCQSLSVVCSSRLLTRSRPQNILGMPFRVYFLLYSEYRFRCGPFNVLIDRGTFRKKRPASIIERFWFFRVLIGSSLSRLRAFYAIVRGTSAYSCFNVVRTGKSSNLHSSDASGMTKLKCKRRGSQWHSLASILNYCFWKRFIPLDGI